MKLYTMRGAVIVCLSFLATSFMMPPGVNAANESAFEQVFAELSQAKEQARELKNDVATIGFFMGSVSSWESHSSILNLYKENISAIRRQVIKLDDIRNIASPWQKTTIDRIRPLLQELAATAESVIDQINQNPKGLKTGEYNDYVKVNTDLAAELAALVGDFVDYGKTKEDLARLTKVAVPSGSL